MTTEKLKYVSDKVLESLRTDIKKNISRYRSGDFADLMLEADWSIELRLDVDLSALSALDLHKSPETEIANSRLVWKALNGLTPSLACEEGIWVRLTHIECLDYARRRWLDLDADDEKVEEDIRTHFFADTLTKRRDDNAISRLWWNAHIANLAGGGDELSTLDAILKKADIRSNIVERSLTVTRAPLAAGIARIINQESWVTDREDNFRAFMKMLNRLGGGIVFEAMSEEEVNNFILNCAQRAGMEEEIIPVSGSSVETLSVAAAPRGEYGKNR